MGGIILLSVAGLITYCNKEEFIDYNTYNATIDINNEGSSLTCNLGLIWPTDAKITTSKLILTFDQFYDCKVMYCSLNSKEINYDILTDDQNGSVSIVIEPDEPLGKINELSLIYKLHNSVAKEDFKAVFYNNCIPHFPGKHGIFNVCLTHPVGMEVITSGYTIKTEKSDEAQRLFVSIPESQQFGIVIFKQNAQQYLQDLP